MLWIYEKYNMYYIMYLYICTNNVYIYVYTYMFMLAGIHVFWGKNMHWLCFPRRGGPKDARPGGQQEDAWNAGLISMVEFWSVL